jgi:Zn-finger nucleic acid-binding protein
LVLDALPDAVMQGSALAPADPAAPKTDVMSEVGPFRTVAERTVACPVCEHAMTEVRSGDVCLDVCTEHGTWFDAGEAARVHDRRAFAPAPPLTEKERKKVAYQRATKRILQSVYAGDWADEHASSPEDTMFATFLEWLGRILYD